MNLAPRWRQHWPGFTHFFALRALGAVLLLAGTAPAGAATFRLDDAASQVVPPTATMEWRAMTSGDLNDPDLEARLTVFARIDTRAWVGRTGRIYLVLALDGGAPLLAQWQALGGRWLPGRLMAGERALVYNGPITQALTEERLALSLRTRGAGQASARRLIFHFELDTP